MNGGAASIILQIIAMVMATAIITTWIRARAPASGGEIGRLRQA